MNNSNFIKTALIFALFCCICSCKKKTTSYDFTATGSHYLGGSLNFTSNAAGAASYQWDFGDSSNSTSEQPVHSYAHAGDFTVKLIVNNDNSHAVIKTVSIGFDSLRMLQVLGTRTYLEEHYYFVPTDSIVYLSDVSLSVSQVSASSVHVNNVTLSSSGFTDSTISFISPTGYSHFYYSLSYNRITNTSTYSMGPVDGIYDDIYISH